MVSLFLIGTFSVSSSHMAPSFYTGDIVIVNKSSYGVRLPLTNNKVLDTGKPEHADIVVLRYPQNPEIYYIERVIGLPGDTVSYNNGQLAINTMPVPTNEVDYDAKSDSTAKLYVQGQQILNRRLAADEALQVSQEEESQAQYFQETHGKHQYLVRYLSDANSSQFAPFLQKHAPEVVSSAGTQWRITVPKGQYFVMGDNRDRSADSRFWGFVPEENLVGKVMYLWNNK